MSKKPSKPVGKAVSVSPKAHEALKWKAFDSKPRLTIRQLINAMLGINKEE